MVLSPFISSAVENWQPIVIIVGLGLTFYQLKQYEKGQKTALENDLNQEYRKIWREVDSQLLMDPEYGREGGNPLSENERDAIYSYVDLTNQQIFLRKRGRITNSRWKDWEAGMETMIKHPPIGETWEDIKKETNSEHGRDFDELRELESPKDFDTDPYYWNVGSIRKAGRKTKELLPLL